MNTQIWKPIPGYENLYHVSNTGEVKSLSNTKFWGNKPNEETLLKAVINTRGYLCVNLYKEGSRKTIRIHKLVAVAFIPNPENKQTVNHINGNKLDNTLENLEWCTWSENALHAYRIGLASNESGAQATRKKIIDTITKQVYLSITEAANCIGMKRNTLNKMLCGKNKNKTSLAYL